MTSLSFKTVASCLQACGHRYVKISSDDRRMIGKCYVRSNDLTFDKLDDWQDDGHNPCDHSKDHRYEGMCNLGISGFITQTDVVLGATGSYHWTGGVLGAASPASVLKPNHFPAL